MNSSPSIHNLKLSVLFSKIVCIPPNFRKQSRKYFIYGSKPSPIFTIYPEVKKINITNVKSIDNICNAIQELKHLINWSSDNSYIIKIDNITASFRPKGNVRTLNLELFCNYIRRKKYINKVKYCNDNFPCAFISSKYGLVILSRKRNYAIVGTKSTYAINKIHYIMQRYMLLFDPLSV